MAREPFMPLFFGDFLAATGQWLGEERALYLLLLAYQWTTGPLPADPTRLATMCQYKPAAFSKLWRVVGRKFVEREGCLVNLRLEEHRARSAELSAKNSSSGRAGAARKWGSDAGSGPLATRAQRLADARARGTHTTAQWAALVEICGPLCLRCGATGPLVKDHITPVYQGGSDAIENLQPLCKSCNCAKGPDATDHRPSDWRERLVKCLASARHLTPSETPASIPSHPIPSGNSSSTSDLSTKNLNQTSVRALPNPEARAHSAVSFLAEDWQAWEAVKSAYPPGTYAQADWLLAERQARQRLDEGATWQELREGAERYAAQCQARNCGTKFVRSPKDFFDLPGARWRDPYPLPQEPLSTTEQMLRDLGRAPAPQPPNGQVIEHEPIKRSRQIARK
jgi:uncharacterized protein YdaU (DUF1376 family)